MQEKIKKKNAKKPYYDVKKKKIIIATKKVKSRVFRRIIQNLI